MGKPFRLGFLSHVESGSEPRRLYQETLDLFVAADQLGFDAGWVAEHHFKQQSGCLPSPFPFLAAAAARTQQLRLGTSIVILPLEHPLRVAEDAAVVDTLSAGRLELGVGSGGDPGEFQAFGRAIADRHVLTSQGVLRLQRALRGEPLGEQDQRLYPPAPTLANRLWQSALSVEGAQHVAQHGVGLMLSRAVWATGAPTDQAQLPVLAAYQRAWGEDVPPRIAVSRGVYLAADKRTALAALRAPVGRFAETMHKLGHFPANLSLEQACERLHLFFGHPEEVAAGLAADKIVPHATDLILQFNPATPSQDQALRMLEQIAGTVAPALGWQPAADSPA